MPEQQISAASHQPGAVIERSREADAFLATIGDAAPEAVSACDGWTTHEVAAHVTGITVEVIRHLEPSMRAIRAALHVGQPRAQRLRDYLAAGAAGRAENPTV
jgi:hypothetical protein